MGAASGALLCGAYCLGLFFASFLVRHLGWPLWLGSTAAAGIIVGATLLAALGSSRWWRSGPRRWLWLTAGLIGIIAACNYAYRTPQPGPQDISQMLGPVPLAGAEQEVWGIVTEMPRLTRSDRGQLWLKVEQGRSLDAAGQPLTPPQPFTGILYVTVPAEDITAVFPGQRVEIRGRLYQPELPKNPNGFNFKQYLADHGCFAGFSGAWVNLASDKTPPTLALWRLRLRIAKAHQGGLGPQAGPLVTAMALGRKAVNLPYDLQDAFIQAGLAHTLAASGFHVSLVLGVVLAILNSPALALRLNPSGWSKVGIGGAVLIGYAVITGGQPSVWRATVMGFGALAGMALERQVKPLGCLLLAVTILLIANPIWIDNVGFQLSVMATLGLMVSVKPITERLEWLPPMLATLAAVPLAAYIWALPLQLHHFNTLTTYSILLNMVVTPLVMVISLGGILSGLVAVGFPELGSMFAWILWLPAQMLIALVKWQIQQPGSSFATGHISMEQMLALYGFLVAGWVIPWWRQRRWLVALLALLVAMGPLWYRAATLNQITVLATGSEAVMVAQNHRQTLLVNSGSDKTARYTVIPFLKQAGINRLQTAVSLAHSDSKAWLQLAATMPIQVLHGTIDTPSAPPRIRHIQPITGQTTPTPASPVRCLDNSTACQFSLADGRRWLMLTGLTLDQQQQLVALQGSGLNSEVLWWDGGPLADDLLAAVTPQVAIASGYELDAIAEQALQQRHIQGFLTERDGAVIWSPQQGYQAYLAHPERATSSLE